LTRSKEFDILDVPLAKEAEMSHTTEISSIVFTDTAALVAAVNELANKGVKCSLEKGGTPRAFYQNQAGMGAADYVLRLAEAKYDVGFYSDKTKRGMVARTDLFAGSVAQVLGTSRGANDTPEQAAMGKLYQTYAIHAATRKAVQQGMTVQRVNNDDGSVRLVVGGIR
jgi:hypothetical protein